MTEMNVFLMLQSFGLGLSKAALVVLTLNELFRSTVRSVVTMYTTANFKTFLKFLNSILSYFESFETHLFLGEI